ncbi:M20 family metallopeptidase [Candidatus Bathyarchaeota archaeon]|nr:M20 family metallopeptidase [Candidatus Bathyarchaeota archaeon]
MNTLNVVDTAKELLKFDTSTNKEQTCAKWIVDYLEDIGAEAELQIVAPDRANAIGKLGVGKGQGIVLSGHIDTVVTGDVNLWKISHPFEPIIKEGNLYGRGACDMKGPCATMLDAAKQLAKENYKKQLTLVFTSGEDSGGWFVRNVISEKKVTPEEAKYGIIPEPSMMDIVRCHKGAGGARIMIHGKAAHSSRPEMGINAIQKAADFLYELRNLQKELNKYPHPLMGPSTVECTIIQGGLKGNIIPDSCTLSMNNRLITGHEGPEVTKKWMEDIIKKLSDKDPTFKATIVSANGGSPLDIPENNEIVQILMKILNREPIGVTYFTEALDYTRVGIPTVICGPGSIDQAHTADEYISLEQLELGVKTFKETIKQVCL